jgi:hypothetical protein
MKDAGITYRKPRQKAGIINMMPKYDEQAQAARPMFQEPAVEISNFPPKQILPHPA